ncbi:MAG: substrate-binding domain-containing protein [Parvibaculaceae bacterium]
MALQWRMGFAALLIAMVPITAQADAVSDAKARSEARMGVQSKWTGPESGPKAQAGKKVVYISSDEQNAISHAWGAAQAEAGKEIGWEVTILDGKGTTAGRLTACTQALALKPDALTLEGDAAGMQDCLGQAAERGIPIVGIHAAGFPGPVPELKLFTNIGSEPKEIGAALADFIIADSNGAGKAMILYDNVFDVARAKAEAMKSRFAECASCTLLGYESSPLAEVTTRTPQLFNAYVQKHGADFQYVMTIADYYYDFAVPALEAAGLDPAAVKLVGSDGTRSAYARIKEGRFQVATVPEPIELQGYQAIDEVNRALNGEKPSGYVTPVFVVSKLNLEIEGGKDGWFVPGNGYKERYLAIWKGSK